MDTKSIISGRFNFIERFILNKYYETFKKLQKYSVIDSIVTSVESSMFGLTEERKLLFVTFINRDKFNEDNFVSYSPVSMFKRTMHHRDILFLSFTTDSDITIEAFDEISEMVKVDSNYSFYIDTLNKQMLIKKLELGEFGISHSDMGKIYKYLKI